MSKKIPLMKPIISREMIDAANNALLNERFVLGESVFKFEEEFARYVGTEYAVSVSSGTDALTLSMLALNIKGKEVITTPASFIATSNSILHAYANPVFADIDLKTYTVDPHEIVERISPKTKAILPVHLYGYPAEMEEITRIANKYDLFIIEDACQSHGTMYKGKMTGNLGDAAAFSFYPSKNMTVCGDGGIVTTNDEKVASRVKELRDCGRISKYAHASIGYTSRLDTFKAAIGSVQLKELPKWNEKRRYVAKSYNRLLSDLNELVLPLEPTSDVNPAPYMFVVRTVKRDDLKSWLDRNDIETGIHYPIPIHKQPIYVELFGNRNGEYPNSEELSNTCLSLPLFPEMTLDEISYVSEKVHEFFGGKSL